MLECGWHLLGHRCECGHLTIPARFYEQSEGKELSHEKAEGQYLAWLASLEKPDFVNPPVMEELHGQAKTTSERPHVEVATDVTQTHSRALKTCNACNKPFDNRGQVCNGCRQAAYRERSQ